MGFRGHLRVCGRILSDSSPQMQMQTWRRHSFSKNLTGRLRRQVKLRSDRRCLHLQNQAPSRGHWLRLDPCRRIAARANPHLHSACDATNRCSSTRSSAGITTNSGRGLCNLLPDPHNFLASSRRQPPTPPTISFTIASAFTSASASTFYTGSILRAQIAAPYFQTTSRRTQDRRFGTASAAMVASKLDGTAIAKGIRERLGQDIADKQKVNPRFKPSLKIIQGASFHHDAIDTCFLFILLDFRFNTITDLLRFFLQWATVLIPVCILPRPRLDESRDKEASRYLLSTGSCREKTVN